MERCTPICRVCMQKSNEFVVFDMPLQNENEEDTSITYLDFFYECTRIEVEPHEGESQCFCLPCGNELRSFYKFIKIAEMTDQILKGNLLVKGKNSRKSDSTFETIAWNLESKYEYARQELFKESIDNEEGQQKYQSVELNRHSVVNETVAHQMLVDLQVEIFHEKNLTKSESLDTDNDHQKCRTELGSISNLPDNTVEKNKKGGKVSVNGTIYKKGPVECAFCHEIIKNRKRLDKHLAEEHQRRSQPCEICGKMVIRMHDHLLIHYREKNKLSRPKTECPICFTKISKQTISRHIRYVHKREIKKQKCPQCLQTFADAHKLKVHIAKGHNSDTNLKCPLCSRIFSNSISLNNHLRTHPCLERKSEEKNFSCERCPIVFSTKRLLDDHTSIHSDERNACEMYVQGFFEYDVHTH